MEHYGTLGSCKLAFGWVANLNIARQFGRYTSNLIYLEVQYYFVK